MPINVRIAKICDEVKIFFNLLTIPVLKFLFCDRTVSPSAFMKKNNSRNSEIPIIDGSSLLSPTENVLLFREEKNEVKLLLRPP